jgi:hypothetical protein
MQQLLVLVEEIPSQYHQVDVVLGVEDHQFRHSFDLQIEAEVVVAEVAEMLQVVEGVAEMLQVVEGVAEMLQVVEVR